MSYKECEHEQGEIGVKLVSNGIFKVFYCRKCKYIEPLDFEHNGSEYDHSDKGFDNSIKIKESENE